MPKYNYGCNLCHREWSQWSAMNNDAMECPHCFSKNIKKLPSIFTVVEEIQDSAKTSKENVIDHIEENREILKNMRESAKNEK